MGDSILYYPPYKEITNNKDNKMTDMFLEVAKSIQDNSLSSSRYGKIFVLRDLLIDINSLENIDTATILKIKILIEGKINGIKKDIRNNQQFNDPSLDSL